MNLKGFPGPQKGYPVWMSGPVAFLSRSSGIPNGILWEMAQGFDMDPRLTGRKSRLLREGLRWTGTRRCPYRTWLKADRPSRSVSATVRPRGIPGGDFAWRVCRLAGSWRTQQGQPTEGTRHLKPVEVFCQHRKRALARATCEHTVRHPKLLGTAFPVRICAAQCCMACQVLQRLRPRQSCLAYLYSLNRWRRALPDPSRLP